MKINLEVNVNKELRDKLNENFNFFYLKKFKFQTPEKEPLEQDAYNCICASLNRIDDIVEHLNNLEINKNSEGVFAFYDLLNNGQTLIECINIIGKIYDCNYCNKNDISSFNKTGKSGKGNDEEYFNYIRSLCSVHPIKTNRHPEYQGNKNEWCPYIDYNEEIIKEMHSWLGISKDTDFVATVYVNGSELSKYVPIKVNEIFNYINKRYNFIKEITLAVDKYNKNKIKELKDTPIKKPGEFDKYTDYLKNLAKEIYYRAGQWDYKAREWESIFDTTFDDYSNRELFEEYKKVVRQAIVRIHNSLQDMSCLDDNFDCNLFNFRIDKLDNYFYQEEKFGYLYPGQELENRKEYNQSFINENNTYDEDRLEAILNIMDKERLDGAKDVELQELAKYIDGYCISNNIIGISDSEWARMMLKVAEPAFEDIIYFDYKLNDWHLYLQIEMAKWMLDKKYRGKENE